MKNSIYLIVIFILLGSCKSEQTQKEAQRYMEAQNNIKQTVEASGKKIYYLELEFQQDCRAVNGEASSSCCRDITPFVFRIAVPKNIFASVMPGDDLINFDLPYLKVFDDKHKLIKHILVSQKGTIPDEAEKN